jgi:hypothetical protein
LAPNRVRFEPFGLGHEQEIGGFHVLVRLRRGRPQRPDEKLPLSMVVAKLAPSRLSAAAPHAPKAIPARPEAVPKCGQKVFPARGPSLSHPDRSRVYNGTSRRRPGEHSSRGLQNQMANHRATWAMIIEGAPIPPTTRMQQWPSRGDRRVRCRPGRRR